MNRRLPIDGYKEHLMAFTSDSMDKRFVMDPMRILNKLGENLIEFQDELLIGGRTAHEFFIS